MVVLCFVTQAREIDPVGVIKAGTDETRLLASHMAVGTLDANDDLDAVVVAQGRAGSPRYALLAYYDLTDGPSAPELVDELGELAGRPLITDLDRDGRMDIAIRGALWDAGTDLRNQRVMFVYYGKEGGGFEREIFPLEWEATTFVADYDADGNLDLMLNFGRLLRGLGARTFAAVETIRVGGMRMHDLLSTDDLDADGNRDVLAILRAQGEEESGIYLASGLADGVTSALQEIDVPRGHSLGASNIDDDAASEIIGFRHVIATGGTRELEMRIWDSGEDGYVQTIVLEKLAPLSSDHGRPPARIEAGDVDGDGDSDVLMILEPYMLDKACEVPDAWKTVRVFLGDGEGGFEDSACHPALDEQPVDFAVADLNRDEISDLIVLTRTKLQVLLSEP